MQVIMNGSSLNSDEEWKFSPDSYGDFYGGLRDVERPSTLHNEPMNDHHDLPPDAFRPMEIPECTNERRSSLSVLLKRESPCPSKIITHDDEEHTLTYDSSTTTSSTISSIEILQSNLPSALKKLPIHDHEQLAANTHWMKIVANVSSDSEDSDSDEEDNAFYNVLGINDDGERTSKTLPVVTCLNFDRSPTKSMSQRLKIRYGIHHNDEAANDSGKNNSTSGSYRAGAKVRFELERAAQKKQQFLESFQIMECPPDETTEGNMLWKEDPNESSFRPYKKGNTAAWNEVIAQGHESVFESGLVASEQGLDMEINKGSNNSNNNNMLQQRSYPHHLSHPSPPPPPNPYGNASFVKPSSQHQNNLPSSIPPRSTSTPINDRSQTNSIAPSKTSQPNSTAPSETSQSNSTTSSQTTQSNSNDRMMERFKTITTTTWSAVSSLLTISKNNNCHIKQTASNYYEHKGTYPGVNLHQANNNPVITSPPTP